MGEPTEVEQAAGKERIRAALDVLESYYDESTGKIDGRRMMNEIAALNRHRDMLLEAMKPFANEANKYDPDEGDSSQRIWDTTLMIGHLREARVAIAAVEGEKNGV